MWAIPINVIIAFLCYSFSLTESMILKQENSLFGPYEAESQNLHWWELTGSAQLAGNVLRLTTDEVQKQGAIWNNYPLYANDWEVHLQFHIHGKGVKEMGDGIAIWYVRESLHSGPVFGSKDHFAGLGVFIDTHSHPASPHNHEHPYISAVVSDGTTTYHHDADGTAGEVGSCHMPVRNLEHPTKIAVSYINYILSVFLDVEGKNEWVQCFRSQGVYLPTGYIVGISAKTSALTDNHDVYSVTTLDMNLPDKQWEDRSTMIPFAEEIRIPPKYIAEVKQHVVEEDAPQVHHEIPHVEESKQADEPKIEKIPSPSTPTSLFTKSLYVVGLLIMLFLLVKVVRQWNARRKEKIQKRLF